MNEIKTHKKQNPYYISLLPLDPLDLALIFVQGLYYPPKCALFSFSSL